jgi:transposase
MDGRSSLSEAQREAAVAWFGQGYAARSVATRLGVARDPVRRLYRRWRIRGKDALVAKQKKASYSFEFKLGLVERFLAGEPTTVLVEEVGLSSPTLLQRWVRDYRREGPEALRPRPGGRPPKPADAALGGESELERLRRENELLRAKVAYLGKLKALREQARE